jgi:hypothetical protein
VHRKLQEKIQIANPELRPNLVQKTPVVGKMSAKIARRLGIGDELAIAQRKWQARELSNVHHQTTFPEKAFKEFTSLPT